MEKRLRIKVKYPRLIRALEVRLKTGDRPVCEADGCQHSGFPCSYLLPEARDPKPKKDLEHPVWYYCPHHAYEKGYCPSCGTFNLDDENDHYEQCIHCKQSIREVT